MVKKLLVKESPLNGYMEEAYALTVAASQDSSYEWIYSNYIQLVFQDPKIFDNQPVKFFKLSFTNGKVWDAECPLLCYDRITRNMLRSMNLDVNELICRAIDNDFYVKLFLDEFYLPYRTAYNNSHYIHESFFYGYDDEKEILYGLAYVDRHFKEFVVEMKNIKQAFELGEYCGTQQDRIIMLSCNPERFYEFDKKVVIRSIEEYLNSYSTDIRYGEINNLHKEFVFGLRIYEELKKYYANGERKNVIPLHIILEHKELMLKRIQYMIDNQHFFNDDGIVSDYREVVNKAARCKLHYLKYLVTKSKSSYDKMQELINDLYDSDKNVTEKLYDLIISDTGHLSDYMYSRWGWWNDVAYPLARKTYGLVEVSFKLHIINSKARGYIRITNEDCLENYLAPFVFRVDVIRAEFGVADSSDKQYVPIQGIKCENGENYTVKFKVDLSKCEYAIDISNKSVSVSYENTYSKEIADSVSFINYFIAIHENSYRYAVSDISEPLISCACENDGATRNV